MTGLLVLLVIAAAAIIIWHNTRPSLSPWYCPSCGSVGYPHRRTRGSLLIELILWLCFLVPGIIYSVWRLTTRYDACQICGAAGMIPATSPRARAELAARPSSPSQPQ